jgi:hypothetical protein
MMNKKIKNGTNVGFLSRECRAEEVDVPQIPVAEKAELPRERRGADVFLSIAENEG